MENCAYLRKNPGYAPGPGMDAIRGPPKDNSWECCWWHAQHMTNPFPSLSPDLLWLVLFLFFYAARSLRLSGASIYGESCADTCSGRPLVYMMADGFGHLPGFYAIQ